MKNREANELKAEVEILKLREIENRKRVEFQEHLVKIFVNEHVQNPYARDEILKIWDTNIKNETNRIDNKWEKKINGMKKSFMGDRDFIQRHNRTRFKQTLENIEIRNSNNIPIRNEPRTQNSSATMVIQDENTTSPNQIEPSINAGLRHDEGGDEHARNYDLETVSTDEDFTDNEESRVLFLDTPDNAIINMLARNFENDSTDDELNNDTDTNAIFRNSYNLRNRPWTQVYDHSIASPRIKSRRNRQYDRRYSTYQNRDLRNSRYGCL